MTEKTAFIACGGTGGHLSPGIALAEALRDKDWHCTLLISHKEVDSRLLKKYPDFDFVQIAGRGFSARPDRAVRFLWDLWRGTKLCRQLIRERKPDVVVGFGGFLSLPALLAGKQEKVPTAIHEANRVAGRVTRLVSRFTSDVYLPHGIVLPHDKATSIRFLGMPVRQEMQRIPRAEAKQALGFAPEQQLLLVMGGSQGAAALNRWANESWPALAADGIQLLCLSGGQEEARVLEGKSASGVPVRGEFLGFCDEMATLLSAADFVVSRSGAGSLAEMLRCRVPGVLIPYPLSADGHQVANAQEFVANGCGVMFDEAELDKVLPTVTEFLANETILEEFQESLAEADATDCAAVMAGHVEELLKPKEVFVQTFKKR